MSIQEINYIDMTRSEFHQNITQKSRLISIINRIIMVTAFYDIGRGDWECEYRRSSMTYLSAAKNYLNYNYEMIFFIDSRYVDIFREWVSHSPYLENKTVISIDDKWLSQNSFIWRQLFRDKEILQSDAYRQHVTRRIDNKYPENIFAEYNAITNSKVDFMAFVIENILQSNSKIFLCWSDFGYFNSVFRNDETRFPTNVLDLEKFTSEKLNFTVKSKIVEQDYDMIYTLKYAREVFATSFFGGPCSLIIKFQTLCHEALIDLHDHNISDDDQHLYMRVFFREPKMFQLYLDDKGSWPNGLLYFQKED